jgi:hypothetical protein
MRKTSTELQYLRYASPVLQISSLARSRIDVGTKELEALVIHVHKCSAWGKAALKQAVMDVVVKDRSVDFRREQLSFDVIYYAGYLEDGAVGATWYWYFRAQLRDEVYAVIW